MPYANEHSCRLEDPDQYDSFSRKNCEQKHEGKCIDVIYGIKGKKSEVQALRFKTKSWTESAARTVCKARGGTFEPAAREKQAMNEKTTTRRACLFTSAEVQFKEKTDKIRRFKIVGYSGQIIKNHWYWGNVAFDLEGLTFAKAKTPILEEHWTSARLGFTTRQEIKNNVTVEGQFLPNDRAQQLADDLDSGFPMEASMYVPPSVVERVAEGESVEVNGRTLKGPGTVFRKAVIKEVSMCVFGADDRTQSVAAGQDDQATVSYHISEEPIMEKDKKTMTPDIFAEQYPDVHQQIEDSAKKQMYDAVMQQFKELKEACGNDTALLVESFESGRTVNQAQAARIQKLEAQLRERTAVTPETPDKAKSASKPADPAVAAFNNEPEAAQPKAFDEKNATDEELEAHYKETKELKDQFTGPKAYIAYVRHP